jgi:hypothetical protein
MKKTEKIQNFAASWSDQSKLTGLDERYLGFFDLFNQQKYYESHDVLEDLWLEQGKIGKNFGFYKGLIQLAGAFVHLQKGRLRPAGALFRLSRSYLSQYPQFHESVQLEAVFGVMARWEEALADAPNVNPITKLEAPSLELIHPGKVLNDQLTLEDC